jgi:hypothetical protein
MIPPSPPALQARAPEAPPALRARYAWGYVGRDGEGRGTLAVKVDAATGEVVVELHGIGERLMLLEGTPGTGYRLQVPRRQTDATARDLRDLPLPFLPEVRSAASLAALLAEGRGPGVRVLKRDARGPVKLRYQGRDDAGREVMVWPDRKAWEVLAAPPSP